MGLSAAALGGWAPWLVPLLVIVVLALCVMRSRRQQRQRRRRQRELASAGRGGMASGVPSSSSASASTVTLSSAVPPAPSAATVVPAAAPLPGTAASSMVPSAASSMSAAASPAAAEIARRRGAGQTPDPAAVHRTGREAGRREVEALEALRGLEFGDREEAALQAQLARAPRDVGALFGLLQWHARRSERAQVESFAHALWDETDAEGELWRRAAVLGRSVDPTNPLYSDDPFTALAEHAARQPTRAPLALDAFDLSLPEAGANPLASMPHPGHASDESLPPIPNQLDSLSDAVRRSALQEKAAYESIEVLPAPVIPPVAFDFLNAPSARLPASFTGLDLDLDLDKPATPAAPATAADQPRKTSDRRRNRGKGTGSSDA